MKSNDEIPKDADDFKVEYGANNTSSQGFVGRAMRDPAFIIVAIVLLIAAVSLQAAVQMLKWHFRKEAVPPAAALTTFPKNVGDWLQITQDGPINDEMMQNLQTDRYVFRDYINTKGWDPKKKAKLNTIIANDKLTPRERQRQLKDLTEDPNSIISVSITYYTGKADTVAHIPERCYLAEGYNQKEARSPKWETNENYRNPPDPKEETEGKYTLDVRFVTFDNPREDPKARTCNVAYFFHANGQFTESSETVRMKLQDLTQRYAYYAKVEMRSGVVDPQMASEQMKEFLKVAMPEINKLLPNWDDYKGR